MKKSEFLKTYFGKQSKYQNVLMYFLHLYKKITAINNIFFERESIRSFSGGYKIKGSFRGL